MSVVGISMVRDEDDIIGYTLPRMAVQLDHIVVADNMSTDSTREIVEEIAEKFRNITIVEDTEPAYFQSRKMTGLAAIASSLGADWVVPFDADEVFYSPSGPLADVLRELPQHFAIVLCDLYDHVVTGLDDEDELDPCARIGWRRIDPVPLPKVACRTLPGLVIEQGNHGAHYPGAVLHATLDIVIHHYPYRSVAQMARKARNGASAYAAAGDSIPESTGRHWRDYGRFLDEKGIAAIEEIFTTWFYEEDPRELLYLDPCPLALP